MEQRALGNEGSTPALGDRQARKLLEAPPADTLKGPRDRAILATLLYHGIRREELCGLRVKDMHSRQGVMHFQVKGKRAKIRFIPVNAAAQRTIEEYLARAGHRGDADGPLFRPVKNNRTGRLDRHLDPASAATNALSHEADIAKVQEWLGHANVSTIWRADEPPGGFAATRDGCSKTPASLARPGFGPSCRG
jgi:site-specific recombinase XerD